MTTGRKPDRHRMVTTLAGCLLLAAVACRTEETQPPPPTTTQPVATPAPAGVPFRVAAVDLGTSITADRKVTAPAATFAPTDTIYASVTTEGAAPGVTLTARWTYEDGQLVDEATQTLVPAGPATTAFRIARPDGWPTGRYKVEISADGTVVMAKEFLVS